MNKTLLIVGGVAAIGIVGYMVFKKNPTSETTATNASDEQKAVNSGAGTSTSQPSCGCGSGQTPCPNERCASPSGTKRDISGMPVMSSTRSTTTKVSTPKSILVPKASNETESFAFTLNF